jgi:N-acetylglucosamine malate deacetylase 2
MTPAPDLDGGVLPTATSILAVCAHPDDESFGLGAVLDRFVAHGAAVAVLCFTHGEGSSLGPTEALGDLRRTELRRAADALGVGRVELLDHPDGSLTTEPLGQLARAVAATAEAVGADLLVVFDEGGVTGHPDHCRATEAALAGAPGLPVLAWAVPSLAADTLNAQFDTAFFGRNENEIDLVLHVDRSGQRQAIACHHSQSRANRLLDRRLTLLGDTESMRWLRRPGAAATGHPATTATVVRPVS